ncbi:unnamed protein product, partial [Coregonus sp. 'balchen']
VAVEISAVCEQTIGEYQEEISRSNEENKRLQSLLSWVFNPEIKLHRAAQSENSKVHQSPTTSSEQDSSNVESNEASHFSNWTDKNILDTDGNSLDSSSCTKEDSEARKPTKRTCHSSGVVNEPSDLSNLCDENNPGTEISPSDSNKDMNIQTDSGAHNPAKRKCQRVQSPSAEIVCTRCGSGEMVACSRPKVPGSTQDYTHCIHCQGLYNRKTLWKHVRYCPLNPKADKPKPGQKMRIQSAMVFKLCPQPDYVSTGLWKIVCGMNSGEVSFVVRNDKYILLMGEEMYNKLQPDDRRIQFIPQRMREMARLLIAARKCTPLMCFEDLVIPSNLPHVITAVRAVAGYNEENKTYDRPTLAVQMGYNLMNIGSAVESCALKSGRYKVAEFAGKFKGFKWNEVVMAGALSTLSKPKMKCAQPDRHTGTKPPHHTGTKPPHHTGTKPPHHTGTQPSRHTGTQPPHHTGTQPPRHTGAQPTRGRNAVKIKWTVDEVAAVEKHMMQFIKSGRVPGKRDCLKCLQSEPVALKSRSCVRPWSSPPSVSPLFSLGPSARKPGGDRVLWWKLNGLWGEQEKARRLPPLTETRRQLQRRVWAGAGEARNFTPHSLSSSSSRRSRKFSSSTSERRTIKLIKAKVLLTFLLFFSSSLIIILKGSGTVTVPLVLSGPPTPLLLSALVLLPVLLRFPPWFPPWLLGQQPLSWSSIWSWLLDDEVHDGCLRAVVVLVVVVIIPAGQQD